MRVWDRDNNFSDILLDERLYKEKCENVLICDISYKTYKTTTIKWMDFFKFIMKLDV